MEDFSFEELKSIDRKMLSNSVPLELYRAIRLIGMYQGLPMHGKSTTATIGRKIGGSLPVKSVDEALKLFETLNIGIPSIVEKKSNEVTVQVDDCFCKGLPHKEGHLVCDLEGAILEGAFTKILNKRVKAKETKCNVNGDGCCEYQVKM
ncbi:4-vinyl reductase [Cytobacillus sp. S13-E01]|uniref:V4R domain-containing protein n=1 Tax=Cytobacillus sp. S13-E01 TaxID=3031326 RepID=UPI0023D8B7C0|nr:V4R domain-containing protein [Cytobacillus sp. S13-E01]MDF0725900.1 4-vinyl reductase [Cytobacillus sp. S13-E01]